jgi:hypothetical protein
VNAQTIHGFKVARGFVSHGVSRFPVVALSARPAQGLWVIGKLGQGLSIGRLSEVYPGGLAPRSPGASVATDSGA